MATRYHYPTIRMTKSKTLTKPHAGQDVEQRKLSVTAGENVKQYGTLWKTIWQILAKLHTLLPYNISVMFSGIYPNELTTYVHTNTYTYTCTQMFTAVLFLISQN